MKTVAPRSVSAAERIRGQANTGQLSGCARLDGPFSESMRVASLPPRRSPCVPDLFTIFSRWKPHGWRKASRCGSAAEWRGPSPSHVRANPLTSAARRFPSGIKRERGGGDDARGRGCPRNCQRRACRPHFGHWGNLGRPVAGDDPRARRPAGAARRTAPRSVRPSARAERASQPKRMRGCHAWTCLRQLRVSNLEAKRPGRSRSADRTLRVPVAANILVWIWATSPSTTIAVLFGSAFLAYTLRPAPRRRRRPYRCDRQFDPQADAARPASGRRGLLFLARSLNRRRAAVGRRSDSPASQVSSKFDALKAWGGVVGTSVSALFLFLPGRVQHRSDDFGLAHLSGGPTRRALLGGGFRHPAQQPRISWRASSGRCSAWSARAGTCSRSASCSASDSTRRPRWPCSASRRRKRRTASPSAPYWSFRPSSPPG